MAFFAYSVGVELEKLFFWANVRDNVIIGNNVKVQNNVSIYEV